jgi:integrase
LKYSTGEKILPKYWNSTKQRAKETDQFKGYSEFNTRLKNIGSAIENCYRTLINDGVKPTPDILRAALDTALDKSLKEKPITLFEFIEKYIEQVLTSRQKGSIQIYNATLKHLKEFSIAKKYKVDFDNINLDFYNAFVEYLSVDKSLLNNTVGKYIKTIKSFLSEASERGLNTNKDFKSRKFKVIQEDIDNIYLTTSELDRLYSADLSKLKSLDRVRDLFIVGCYTGLRFSDFSELKKENITLMNSKKYFSVTTTKTKEKVVIPIKPIVLDILNKYEGELPRAISNQKMNEYLKELGKHFGLDDKVIIKKTSGNNTLETVARKYELISTHTARRSFATNAYKEGVPSIAIMKITGHRSEKAFLKYIKISKEENAERLSLHPYFM